MNYHEFFRKLENYLEKIERQPSLKETLGVIIQGILTDFTDDLGLTGARLYYLEGGRYTLVEKYGAESPAPIGFAIPENYPPIRKLRRKGFIYMDLQTLGVDPELEGQFGVKRFAALAVGPGSPYVIAFGIREDRFDTEDEILFMLSSIRHSVSMKLQSERLEDVIYQSKEIQVSLLPYEDPSFEGFDISGATRPAEIVGGDLYDFISINPKILGVAIGDATGHGFTAALQARDAVIGLRMGISEDVKMVKVLERLNRIIHRSHLTSRFVSLFYMEIENTGQAIYSNAGHTTPYYYRAKKKRFYPLTEGGIVLGPTSEAHYARGFIKLHPGDGVIMVTDGITEAVNETGEEYGEKRVLDYVRDHIGRLSARELVSGLLESVAEHAAEDLYTDDRTVVFVRRLPE